MANKAVFLDRDGTLIVDKVYLGDPAGVEILPGVKDALLKIMAAGYDLFIVSNQSGVGRGKFTEADMHRVNDRMCELLKPVEFKKIYCCPCAPEDPKCNCRKPSPKFLFRAEEDYLINLRKCFFIGDRETDVQCAINGGCHPILLLTGHGRESQAKLAGKKYHTAEDFAAAADLILKH
ncbi:MAG: HAD family hydrolase [Verrucomicrobiae bacterium]|nr:HAD family hydrolase [Verrucomicrobiae bacterium]